VGRQNVPLLERKGARLVVGDICDYALVEKTIDGVDSVFHLAAMNRAQRSIQNPLEANAVNVDGTLNLLEASRKKNVKKFVFASSSSVYGGGEKACKEDQKLRPLHPYGVGKLAGEEYCRIYSELYGLNTVSLRYVSVYGPRQRADIDYAAVVPKFARAILAREPLTAYGDGKQTRQFTFVRDTVNATLLAWKNAKSRGEVFNVASGEETSVNEIAKTLEALTGLKASVKREPPLKGDPKCNPIDVSKAKRVLGFKAKYSFEKGLVEMLDSLKQSN
ncbi:GDP-mannose 4,6-dehydratase, partial [Candidatus Micrarchaeota archaeon]|nr:GDP-mannose 4,6-dehydratase [Candidatus Micrarchaeota archaeon]